MTSSSVTSDIDVVVPTYRRPSHLQRCLEALTTQSTPAARVIVVARADDLESHHVVSRFGRQLSGLQLVTVTEPGVIAAMSAGVAATTAPVIAFTDDDAAPHADWLQRLGAHFAEDPTVGAVGGRDIVPSDPKPRSGTVGVFRRSGRLIGNHHVGMGPPRYVDVLKGVNMAFRAEALALPAPGVLRGSGAQVDFEVLCCSYARGQGWRIVYDPAIVVDHDPGPRYGPDGRRNGDKTAVSDAAHNSVVASSVLERQQRCRRAGYSVLVGSWDRPGVIRALVGSMRGESDVVHRALPSLRGALAGLTLVGKRPRMSAVVVRAVELRRPGQMTGGSDR